MEKTPTLHYQILIGAAPGEADLAIVSIDNWGNLGDLNAYVLKHYGYSEKDLPNKEQLQQVGFSIVSEEKNRSKPIIFIVTIDGRKNTRDLLRQNLHRALVEFKG